MITKYPGTTIEVLSIEKGGSKVLFNGLFAAGGVTLSQVSNMTGLEPYLIQNWVKRKFLSHPKNKVYNKEQFARIVIINMLREILQIESICSLLQVIEGPTTSTLDDLIKDDELYHRYFNMICEKDVDMLDKATVLKLAEEATEDFKSTYPGGRQKLIKILQIMFYAHKAARLSDRAKELISSLD